MPHTGTPTATDGHQTPAGGAYQLLTAASMTIGRGPAARAVAGVARLTPGDRVIDIGCGPGAAVREATRRGAIATGVDPTPLMLRLARWISAIRRVGNVTWVQGSAESLPLPDASATVVWALSSVHHWCNRAAGLCEARRVLADGGRILLAERLVKPGGGRWQSHASHGLTRAQADTLARELSAAGFADVRTETRCAGRRTLVIVAAVAAER
jgi:SAM-dependent methyltransferase